MFSNGLVSHLSESSHPAQASSSLFESTCEVIRDNFSDSETRMQEIGIMKNDFDANFNLQF